MAAKKESEIRELKKSRLDSFAISIFCSEKCPEFDNGPNLILNPDLGQGSYERYNIYNRSKYAA